MTNEYIFLDVNVFLQWGVCIILGFVRGLNNCGMV